MLVDTSLFFQYWLILFIFSLDMAVGSAAFGGVIICDIDSSGI